jgi:hypothetical protein
LKKAVEKENMKIVKGIVLVIPALLSSCMMENDKSEKKSELSTSAIQGVCTGILRKKPTATSGLAYDITANAGAAWVIGTRANGAGYRTYWYNGNGGWVDGGGGAVKIALRSNIPFVVNSLGDLYWRNGSSYSKLALDKKASEYATNDGGFAAIIEKHIEGGAGLVFSVSSLKTTQLGTIKAKAVSVDDFGNIWICAEDGLIYEWNGSSWVNKPGMWGHDIGATGLHQAYIISTEPAGTNGNYAIYKWETTCWVRVVDDANTDVSLSGARIDAASENKIWYTKKEGNIFSAQ